MSNTEVKNHFKMKEMSVLEHFLGISDRY